MLILTLCSSGSEFWEEKPGNYLCVYLTLLLTILTVRQVSENIDPCFFFFKKRCLDKQKNRWKHNIEIIPKYDNPFLLANRDSGWKRLMALSNKNRWKQLVKAVAVVLVTKSCLTLLCPHGLQLSRLLYPWGFPGKSTGVVIISFSRGSSWPRDGTCISSTAGGFFTT